MTDIEHDYVLGTGDDELRRLGIQHRVWRPYVLRCWERAGVAAGSRVIDLGAGPGYCTMDLAEIVGSTGRVVAIEQSRRFLDAARLECRRRKLCNVDFIEQDLLETARSDDFDVAWCRWVACFVKDPPRLVSNIAACVRTGGVALFHEYIDYRTWRLAPRCPLLEEFVHEVMASWRDAGGEPDIALPLLAMLRESGFAIHGTRPLVFAVTPQESMWQWPAEFLENNLRRLVELNRFDNSKADEVRRSFAEALSDSDSLMVTPMVLEIVAQRLPD